MTHDHDEREAPRPSRRRLVRYALGSAGLLALSGSGIITLRDAMAKDGKDDDDDHDDDSSGHGSDNSGHGNDHDDHDDDDDRDDETVTVTGEIPPDAIRVTIVDDDANGFSPRDITVDLGQKVTFINAHDDPHTATGSGFDTGIMQPGQTATVVLDKAGRFAYACQIHPEMTGTIAVRDANGQIPERSTGTTAPAEATLVQITNFAFEPATLRITTGTAVTWTNGDTVPHTVTALDGAFDSGIFDPGATFNWQFNDPGTFDYHCDLHPQMLGTVEVTGDPVAASSPQASPSAATPEPRPAATPTATATSAAATTSTEPVTIAITSFLFDPPTVEVPAGTQVTWRNDDPVPHTATALDASFDTGRLDQGQDATLSFDTPGTFDYRCSFHPSMVGQIIVT